MLGSCCWWRVKRTALMYEVTVLRLLTQPSLPSESKREKKNNDK